MLINIDKYLPKGQKFVKVNITIQPTSTIPLNFRIKMSTMSNNEMFDFILNEKLQCALIGMDETV